MINASTSIPPAKPQYTVDVYGFSQTERIILRSIFNLSARRMPNFYEFTPTMGSAPDVFLVDAEDAIAIADFRQKNAMNPRPAVLIGALNDAWAIRFTENLRFEPQEEGSLRWILDRKNPTSRAWSINSSNGSFAGQRSTYAVISKLLIARSDKPALMLAGLTGPGTATVLFQVS